MVDAPGGCVSCPDPQYCQGNCALAGIGGGIYIGLGRHGMPPAPVLPMQDIAAVEAAPQDDGITDDVLAVEMREGLGLDAVNKPLLSTDSEARKNMPVYSGVLAYFPRAIAYVAQVSKAGNDKHNPGQPLHWSKDKSNDHADCAGRHLIEHGTVDPTDNMRHSGKLAWRALALLETELENAEKESN